MQNEIAKRVKGFQTVRTMEREGRNLGLVMFLSGGCSGCGEDHEPEDCKQGFERDYDLEAKDAEVMKESF